MVHSTTPLLVPHADSSQTNLPGLRLRDHGADDNFPPTFADLFSRSRAEQSAAKPVPARPRAIEKAKPEEEDDAHASSVEETPSESRHEVENAPSSDSDKADASTDDNREDTEDGAASHTELTPRPALPVDLPPAMTVAVVKAASPAANVTPVTPALAAPVALTSANTPAAPVALTPATPAAQNVHTDQATGAPVSQTLSGTASLIVSNLPVTDETKVPSVPVAAAPNPGQASVPAPTPDTLHAISSDFSGVPMDSNALAANAAAASGVEFAMPQAAPAHAAPDPIPAPGNTASDKTATSAPLNQAPVVQTLPNAAAQSAPAAKMPAPTPTLTIPAPANAAQAQVTVKSATPVPTGNVVQVPSGNATQAASVSAPTTNTPVETAQSTLATKAGTAQPTPTRVPVAASSAETRQVSVPTDDRNRDVRPALPVSTPAARVVSARPNSVSVPSGITASPHAATTNPLPVAFASTLADGTATPFTAAFASGQTESAANVTVNPLALATASSSAADVHAVGKAAAQNTTPEHAVQPSATNAVNLISSASGRQAETGGSAQDGSREENGGSALSQAQASETVSGASKTDNPAVINSYAAAVDKAAEKANVTSAAPDSIRTSSTERQERARLIAQVTKHLESLRVHENGGEMALRLRPDHLGSLRVSISTHSDSVVARIVAEHTGVQQALESAKNELRQALESKGLQLDRLEVTVQQNGAESRSAFGNSDSSAQNAAYRASLRSQSRPANVPDSVAPVAAASNSRRERSALLDRVA